jgi:AcrR family transcriptional regulator
MDAGTSFRERKKIKTRRQVMAVALRLFQERGFDETTVEDIAAAAEISPRTFFRYFPSKVDVIFGDHQELVMLIRQTLAERPTGEPVIRTVRRAMQQGVGQVVADPELFLTRMQLTRSVPAALAHNRLLDLDFENVIAEAVARSRGTDPATDLYARMVGKLVWSANLAASEVWLASNASRNPRRLLDEAFDIVEQGVPPELT